jgi:hypothetical protein
MQRLLEEEWIAVSAAVGFVDAASVVVGIDGTNERILGGGARRRIPEWRVPRAVI